MITVLYVVTFGDYICRVGRGSLILVLLWVLFT